MFGRWASYSLLVLSTAVLVLDKSLMVKNRFRHLCPLFEYEFEYRFTEYEYDLPDEHIAITPLML